MVEVFINVKLMNVIHTNICDSKTGAKARTGWADFVIFSGGRKVIIHIDKVFISFAKREISLLFQLSETTQVSFVFKDINTFPYNISLGSAMKQNYICLSTIPKYRLEHTDK